MIYCIHSDTGKNSDTGKHSDVRVYVHCACVRCAPLAARCSGYFDMGWLQLVASYNLWLACVEIYESWIDSAHTYCSCAWRLGVRAAPGCSVHTPASI